MSIETSYGFRSAQAAYERATPFDGECTCEGAGFICAECGHIAGERISCPDREENHPDDEITLRELEPDEIPEHFPNSGCPTHGWCTGCTRRNCEDCGGEEPDGYDD